MENQTEILCTDGKLRLFTMIKPIMTQTKWSMCYYVIKNGQPFGGGTKLISTKPKWASAEDWEKIQKFYNGFVESLNN